MSIREHEEEKEEEEELRGLRILLRVEEDDEWTNRTEAAAGSGMSETVNFKSKRTTSCVTLAWSQWGRVTEGNSGRVSGAPFMSYE